MPTGSCLSCQIVSGQAEPAGGVIAQTPFFHAHQDVAYPVPGQVIVASKRHFRRLDEMTAAEVQAFLPFVQRFRSAQARVLDVEAVYYFYNEDTTHHFHLWMMPRHDWMKPFGRSVESVRPALLHAREQMQTPENEREVARVAGRLRAEMALR